MALKTFKNLKPERQEEILLACYAEFALKGYKSASLTEVIKTLNLAKGSFYRYFTNKKELYAFLLQDASQRRLSKLDELIQNPSIDFFTLIKQNFLDKVQFDLDYPVIGGFLFRVMHERDTSEISDIVKAIFEMVVAETKAIIELPKYNKELAFKDATLVAFQIFHTQLWLYDFIAFKYNINFEENIINRIPIVNIPENDIKALVEQAVEMLKNGIKLK